MTKKWGKMTSWPTIAVRVDPKVIAKIDEKLANINCDYKMAKLVRALLTKYVEGKVYVIIEQ